MNTATDNTIDLIVTLIADEIINRKYQMPEVERLVPTESCPSMGFTIFIDPMHLRRESRYGVTVTVQDFETSGWCIELVAEHGREQIWSLGSIEALATITAALVIDQLA